MNQYVSSSKEGLARFRHQEALVLACLHGDQEIICVLHTMAYNNFYNHCSSFYINLLSYIFFHYWYIVFLCHLNKFFLTHNFPRNLSFIPYNKIHNCLHILISCSTLSSHLSFPQIVTSHYSAK